MFKLWQRGKEIRSECSNKKHTHHQTELTFRMRLLLIATSLALAAVSDALETHFPLQINFLNPNTIQGGPTQRGPSKVASSSREGSLQIQTKIATGTNLVFFWQQLQKVAGARAPDIMTRKCKIFPKVAFGTPSAPRTAPKPFEFKWWDFLTSLSQILFFV